MRWPHLGQVLRSNDDNDIIVIGGRWGEWTKCDPKYPGGGRRERFRTCRNICSDQKAEAGECRGYESSLHQQTLTTTDWTACSPCPAEERSSWSEWGEWRIPDTHLMYCGPGTISMTRETVPASTL